MRCLERNKRPFYAALYVGSKEIIDEYGNATGQYGPIYSNPMKMFGNISAAQGDTEARQFGGSTDYDKVIVLDTPNPQIDEYSRLWIDSEPTLSKDGALALDSRGNAKTPHDYIVKKVASSLNSTSIAISKVTVR